MNIPRDNFSKFELGFSKILAATQTDPNFCDTGYVSIKSYSYKLELKHCQLALFVAVAWLVSIVSQASAQESTRQWSDKTGRFSVAAEFVDSRGDAVRLKKVDGEIITVLLARLSSGDQDFVAERLRRLKEDKSKPESGEPNLRAIPIVKNPTQFQAIAAIKELGGNVEESRSSQTDSKQEKNPEPEPHAKTNKPNPEEALKLALANSDWSVGKVTFKLKPEGSLGGSWKRLRQSHWKITGNNSFELIDRTDDETFLDITLDAGNRRGDAVWKSGAKGTALRRDQPKPVVTVDTMIGDFQPQPKPIAVESPHSKAVAAIKTVRGSVKPTGETTGIHVSFFASPATNDDLKHLAVIDDLRDLQIFMCPKLTDEGMAHLAGLKQLKSFQLIGNDLITDAGLHHLNSVPNLESLMLAGAGFSNDGLAELKNLQQLKTLILVDAQFGDAGMDHLKKMPSLTSLELISTSITDAGLAQLKEIPNLSRVNLMAFSPLCRRKFPCRLTDTGLEHLAQFNELTTLILSKIPVTDAGLVHLKRAKKLTNLSLSGTEITDAGLSHLREIAGLKNLTLFDTEISDGGLVHLERLAELRNLNLKNTRITDAGIQRLQQALPKCVITPP